MKNVKENQLKKCIILTVDEFKKIFVNIFGKCPEGSNDTDVEINGYEGISFFGVSTEEAYTKFSEYFDVDVTSIHVDQEDYTGVWICYKEEKF